MPLCISSINIKHIKKFAHDFLISLFLRAEYENHDGHELFLIRSAPFILYVVVLFPKNTFNMPFLVSFTSGF